MTLGPALAKTPAGPSISDNPWRGKPTGSTNRELPGNLELTMAEEARPIKELTGETEYIELRPLVVKEHLLRLFNNQIQRDYVVSEFAPLDGNVVVKLKRRTPLK
jgi:hypothetical protein